VAVEYALYAPGPFLTSPHQLAESTLQVDRTFKKRLYAEAGLPVYRIINLVDRRLETFTEPTGPAAVSDYRLRHDYGPADSVPLTMEGREIARVAIADLLP
jgi:hypothetical protein